jgi:hypothetical protein
MDDEEREEVRRIAVEVTDRLKYRVIPFDLDLLVTSEDRELLRGLGIGW